MDRDQVIGLIAENAFGIRENLQPMEDRQLTCAFNGKAALHVESLVNLEAILAEYEHADTQVARVYRKNPELGPRLEALMNERDHLLVAISAERDASPSDPQKLAAMHKRVAQLENEIKRDWGDGAERTDN